MVRSKTINLQVLASTPVDIKRDVTAITGYRLSKSMKLSSSALPCWSSPVIFIMYLGFSLTNS